MQNISDSLGGTAWEHRQLENIIIMKQKTDIYQTTETNKFKTTPKEVIIGKNLTIGGVEYDIYKIKWKNTCYDIFQKKYGMKSGSSFALQVNCYK